MTYNQDSEDYARLGGYLLLSGVLLIMFGILAWMSL